MKFFAKIVFANNQMLHFPDVYCKKATCWQHVKLRDQFCDYFDDILAIFAKIFLKIIIFAEMKISFI